MKDKQWFTVSVGSRDSVDITLGQCTKHISGLVHLVSSDKGQSSSHSRVNVMCITKKRNGQQGNVFHSGMPDNVES